MGLTKITETSVRCGSALDSNRTPPEYEARPFAPDLINMSSYSLIQLKLFTLMCSAMCFVEVTNKREMTESKFFIANQSIWRIILEDF